MRRPHGSWGWYLDRIIGCFSLGSVLAGLVLDFLLLDFVFGQLGFFHLGINGLGMAWDYCVIVTVINCF
ncbi:hypothetical protein BDV32DRAFT_122275 [Aspergillus pseudonomiae]|nr:hypothetical protein BDV32DRAFT_122275 [Aspergillus pseudonomiae]